MDSSHILVVDDEETTLRSMVVVLEDAGFQVSSAESGKAALTAVKEAAKAGNPFDFLLFDIRMPHMTGPQLIEELEECGMLLPSLAITGHADPGVAEKLESKGCHILEKPFHGAQLLDRISEILTPPEQTPDL
jgi:DNA-binding NtrC family response regulator